MELLRFDSRRPNEKYADLIERLREKLSSVAVIAGNLSVDFSADALIGQSQPHFDFAF
jgi:hypothetical protein